MSSYLLNRNGYYHFRIRIPSDLTSVITAAELVKSLKTKTKRTAQTAALPYQQGIIKTFVSAPLRFISGEQAREHIEKVLKRKHQIASAPTIYEQCTSSPKQTKKKLLLSTVVKQFIND